MTKRNRIAAESRRNRVATASPAAGMSAEETGRELNALPLPSTRAILERFQLGDIISHLIRRAHFAAEDQFAREFAAEAITPRQKAALIQIYQHPGMSQSILAAHLFMDRNTVAEMVSRLAANGLIRRVPAPDDRRAYGLFLAEPGARLLDRVMPRDVTLEQDLLQRIPAEDRDAFIRCLRLIARMNETRD